MVFLSWFLRLIQVVMQWKSFGVEAAVATRVGRKNPEELFWTCEDKGLKGLGISLDVRGRAEGDVGGDLQISVQWWRLLKNGIIGKGMNLEWEVVVTVICWFCLPSIYLTSFYPWYFNFPSSKRPSCILYSCGSGVTDAIFGSVGRRMTQAWLIRTSSPRPSGLYTFI